MGKVPHLNSKSRAAVLAFAVAGLLSGFATTASAGPVISGDLIVGDVSTYKVKKHESLFDIARKFDMGIIELEAANPGVNPWKPKAGTEITVTKSHVIPSITHEGIVVNLDASRLYYFKGPGEVVTYPVASGKEGWETPVAATKVVEKRLHPTWTIPEDIRAEDPTLPESVPPGPGNPLGDYALALGLSGIMIHGTTTPSSIGKHASHGCIRMYPEDIESLFKAVKKGTPVLLARMPYVMGWKNNKLYLEVTPRVHAVVARNAKKPKPDKLLHDAVTHEAGAASTVDWDAVDNAMARADGIPTEIGSRPWFGPPMPDAPKPTQGASAAPAQPAPMQASAQTSLQQRVSLTIINDKN
jgi:L,D-transpeptidase ErfK/SrfK